MRTLKIDNLIIKFLDNSANTDELDSLQNWIQDRDNYIYFKNYVRTHFLITLSTNNSDPDKIKHQLLSTIREGKKAKRNKKSFSILKYAAVFVLVISSSLYFRTVFFKSNDVIIPKIESITLELDNGNVKILNEDGTSQVQDANGNVVGTQNGSKLVYDNKVVTKKLSYNTLTVPYGKRFDLILSDSTHVFLNSGTSLKYPEQFIAGKDRIVFLRGEAFFDVAKDSAHPFIVSAQELSVQVLGTKFNVSNYMEDINTEIVLVEGSVSMKSKNATKNLAKPLLPGYKGSYNKIQHTTSLEKVNTGIYTDWINGNVIFRNAPFNSIIKKLERLYNVTIVNHNELLGLEVFNASFEVEKESINDVLRYFRKIYRIDYKIVDNTIIIT